MPFVSVVSGCFNEEENIPELYERVTAVFREHLPHYTYEFIVIDNASQDNSAGILKAIAARDPRVKVIVNNRNFGHIRSGYHALMQSSGEAVIAMASDLQDPPEMIPQFIAKWEQGFKIVLAQKINSKESPIFFLIRKMYYHLIGRLSDIELVKNATGFGLYDKRVIDDVRDINDPYPYFRGLICDLGYQRALVPFTQPARLRGFTKNNFYSLYDMAILGITNHSKVPLRIATFSGFCIGALSFLVALGYLAFSCGQAAFPSRGDHIGILGGLALGAVAAATIAAILAEGGTSELTRLTKDACVLLALPAAASAFSLLALGAIASQRHRR